MLSHVLPTPELLSIIVLLVFLVQIIVLATSFKNTSMSLVVFNCILVLVVLELQ